VTRCEICGRHIRTGRKYCYEHRHSSNPSGLPPTRTRRAFFEREALYIVLFGIALLLFSLFFFYQAGFLSKVYGVIFIVLGIVALYWGVKDFRNVDKRLLRQGERAKRRRQELIREIKEERKV